MTSEREAMTSEHSTKASPADGMKKRERASATFRADFLHALEPLIRASQESYRFAIAGLIIEPVESGGVILVATDGHTLGALYDRSARASRAMRLTIPDQTFAAVTPPKPVAMWSEGESFDIPLPEWAQPRLVWAWSLSICVFPAMHLPGEAPEYAPMLDHAPAEEGNVYAGGFRLHDDPPTLDWRKVLARPPAAGGNGFALNPHAMALFDRVGALYKDALRLTLGHPGEPAYLTSEDGSFVGAMMPVAALGDAPMPAWAKPMATPTSEA